MVAPNISRTWDITEVRYLYKGNEHKTILYGSLTIFQVKRTLKEGERILSAVHKKVKFKMDFDTFVQNSESTVLEIYGEKQVKN